MVHRFLAACFVVGLVLTPAYGQRLKERSNDFSRTTIANPFASKRSLDLGATARTIVTLTNAFRKEEGKGPLKVNPQLSRAARYFADYLARTDKFSHTADGDEPWGRAARYGYEYCIVAENIAYRYSSAGFTTRELAEGLMRGWKKSPGHRKNLLHPDVTEIGVAVARSKHTGRYYAVQDFGRPKSQEITFRI